MKNLVVFKRDRKVSDSRRNDRGVGRAVVKTKRRSVILEAIGERMRHARMEVLKMTQPDFGKVVGQFKGRGVQDNERGLTMPSGDTLFHLLKHGINANWVLDGRGKPLVRDDKNSHLIAKDIDDGGTLSTWNPDEIESLVKIKDPISNLFRFKFTDPSMAPAFSAGDVAICRDPRPLAKIKDEIYVIDVDGVKMARRIVKHGRNFVMKADNRSFGAIEFTKSEMRGRVNILAEVLLKVTPKFN